MRFSLKKQVLAEYALYLRRLSQPGSNGCCGFFGLFGRVLKVVLPDVSTVSVAGIFRGQQMCTSKVSQTAWGNF